MIFHERVRSFLMADILHKLTITEAWRRSRSKYGELDFLGYPGETALRYKDVDRVISRIQEFLVSQGIGPGDKVGLISESRPEWGMVYLAVTTMGAVIVPVMVDFSEEQIANILDHSDSRYLFASEKVLFKLKNSPFVSGSRLTLLKDGLKKGICSVRDDQVIFKEEESHFFEAASESGSAEDLTYDAEENDTAAILYTSGTTGVSKGVMLSHKNITHNAMVGVDIPKVQPRERFLSVLPLAHSYECSLGFILPMIAGAEIRYIKGAPSARILLPALDIVRPHHMLTVPILMEKIYRLSILPKFTKSAFLGRLYRIPTIRLLLNRFIAGKKLKTLFGGNLRFFGVGGAPLAPDVELFLREAHFPYSVGYGLTESSPCLAGAEPSRSVFRAIGPAFRDVQLRIADVNPETGHGEIQAKGPNIMKGYYKDEEKTAEAFSEDGWLKTGDLGFLNEKGILFIKGRLKNMILGPNGENIYPEEIEAVINRDPFVQESLVIRMGNSLVARVQLNSEKLDEFIHQLAVTPEELNRIKSDILESIRNKANNRLNMLSRLSELIEQVEPFEKTPSLKIKRFLYV
jgi:long-chain acyl-CoA synthetase